MNIKEILTKDELASITARNNFAAAAIVSFDWLVITATFTVVAIFPNPITILLGLFIIGARQLGLAVVVHETGHRTLFSSQFVNEFVGTWLAGYWVFSDKDSYMRVHLKHHQDAGTDQDPDLSNYKRYPIDRASLRRKIKRDLTGQVGWKRIKSIARAVSGINGCDRDIRKYLLRSLGVNAFMLLVMTLFGAPWLYLMWVGAFMTSHMLVVRIRQIGEHAAVPDNLSLDPRQNTRTLYIHWLERFFIAPHHVSFHLEHHILASVPIYQLEKMHKLLLKKECYKDLEFQKGYFNLLKKVTYA